MVKVTPLGRAPVLLKVGAGKPVAVTVKVPAVPTVKVVVLAEVMAGAVRSTVRVKDWVAAVPDPVAGRHGDRVGAAGAGCWGSGQDAGSWRSSVTPVGQRRLSRVKVGAGEPVAVTVKVPAVPTVKVVLLAEVIAGAWFDGEGEGLRGRQAPTPFVAVMVIG